VLADDRLDDSRHLVGAAASASRHDEFDGLGRFPCGMACQGRDSQDGRSESGTQSDIHVCFHFLSPGVATVR